MGKLLGRMSGEENEYPDSDGKPMAETDIHRDLMFDLIERLKARYADRNDVYVTGNLFVYYVENKPTFCLAPDCFVAFGVPNRRRRSFRTWKEGVYPSVTFEITSSKTEAEDTGPKFATYQDVWKVRELFYLDPTGDYLATPLVGYRLSRGKFKPIRPTHGRIASTELGITLETDGTRLLLRDGQTGEELLRSGEAELRRERAARLADAAEFRAELDRLKAEVAALKNPPAH